VPIVAQYTEIDTKAV